LGTISEVSYTLNKETRKTERKTRNYQKLQTKSTRSVYSHVSKSISKSLNAATTQQFISNTPIKHCKQCIADCFWLRYRYW